MCRDVTRLKQIILFLSIIIITIISKSSCSKTADLQADNASCCDTSRACRSAIFSERQPTHVRALHAQALGNAPFAKTEHLELNKDIQVERERREKHLWENV